MRSSAWAGAALALIIGTAQADVRQYQTVTVHGGGQTAQRETLDGVPLTTELQLAGQDGQNRPYTLGGSATSSSQPGMLKGSVSASFDGTQNVSASLFTHQWDTLTFNAGAAGDLLLVHYSLIVRGSTAIQVDPMSVPPGTANEAGVVRWQVAQFFGQQMSSAESETTVGYDGSRQTINSRNLSGTDEQVYGRMDFVGTVTAGQAMDFYLYMHAETTLNLPGMDTQGWAQTNVSSALYWGGVSKITTMDGAPLDYTVDSMSGANYALSFEASPAPEPGTWALMAVGGLALAGLARRRQRAQAEREAA